MERPLLLMGIRKCCSHTCSLPANTSAIKEAHLQSPNLLGRKGNIELNQSSACSEIIPMRCNNCGLIFPNAFGKIKPQLLHLVGIISLQA